MFTIKDIEMLEVPADTKMILVRGRPDLDMDLEMIHAFVKQVKKALKMPVVFVPDGLEVIPVNGTTGTHVD